MVQAPACDICSGKRPFCIHRSYPLMGLNIEREVQSRLKKDLFGPGYSVFVGRSGYPDVFAGPMIGLENLQGIDSPQEWFGMGYSRIIELRSFLLRSKKNENVFSRSRFVSEIQELSMASRPADVEISLQKKPVFSFRISDAFQPMGPSGNLEKMRVAENVRVRPSIERIVSDDLKASEQAFLLHQKGLSVYRISSIFSSGILGSEKKRKLVPSRWSTTAIDDLVGKGLIERIKNYPSINEYLVFEETYLDNHFVILLMPGSWEFENFEAWAPGSNWSEQTRSRIIQEHEPFEGRKEYAESQAGGYYATRTSAVKFLDKIKRQAKVIGFREVGEGYSIPLGVWVVRQTSEKAFENMKAFHSREEALEYVSTRLRIPVREYLRQSKILGRRTLFDYGPEGIH